MFIDDFVVAIVLFTLDVRNYCKLLLGIPLAGVYPDLGGVSMLLAANINNQKYPSGPFRFWLTQIESCLNLFVKILLFFVRISVHKSVHEKCIKRLFTGAFSV